MEAIEVILNGRESTPYSGSVLTLDTIRDLAVLQIACGSARLPFSVLLSPGEEVVVGEEIGLFGHMLGGRLGENVNYSRGSVNRNISLEREYPGVWLMQVDSTAAPGVRRAGLPTEGWPGHRRVGGRTS